MKSFIEFVAEQERMVALPGVYAAAKAKYNDVARVKKLVAGLPGKEPEGIHCTIAYSRVHVPTEVLQPVLDIWDGKKGEEVRCTEVRVFNNPSATKPGQPPVGALVLVLDCDMMTAMHNACRDLGCSYDYNEYVPHVSLLYGVPLDAATEAVRRIQEALDAEPLTVTLSNPYIEPLKAD